MFCWYSYLFKASSGNFQNCVSVPNDFLLRFQDAIVMIWNCTMSAVEWNKKEDLLQEQALRHLRQYVPVFVAFSTNVKSEIALLNKIQVHSSLDVLSDYRTFVLHNNYISGLVIQWGSEYQTFCDSDFK